MAKVRFRYGDLVRLKSEPGQLLVIIGPFSFEGTLSEEWWTAVVVQGRRVNFNSLWYGLRNDAYELVDRWPDEA